MIVSSLLAILITAALIGGTVVVTRLMWVFPGAYLPRWLSARIRERDPTPSWRSIAVVGWCGMRGVVSLAAALAVPHTLPSGAEFPERDLILFFTFAVILITLVGQGLSLPSLIRKLRVTAGHAEDYLEREARRTAAKAALTRIEAFAATERLTPDAESQIRDALEREFRNVTGR